MSFLQGAIRQPVTVLVGVMVILLAGMIALQRLPIQLTPNVEDTVITVTTLWEGASPEEVEQEIIDEQEEKLQGVANLREMTSQSLQGSGTVRLEFVTGTPIELALREVGDKLREVPSYPENVYEPVIELSDPHNRDYIAWIVFETTDESLDIRTWQDFAEDRIAPVLERIEGMSEINVLGGREEEVQVRFDPVRLAQHGVGITQLVQALRQTNRNVSGGEVPEGKSDVRLRLVGQYVDLAQIERTVINRTDAGPVRVSDVAEVTSDYKEAVSFVHSSGSPVIAINAQKEVGANVMEVMNRLREKLDEMNAPNGLLDSAARSAGLNGTLKLRQVYDQTIYIDDALLLVQNNIWIGGALAGAVLLLFLRSLRSAGIIGMAIPISIVGAVALMTAMGRTVNVISLAGMAFAVGMVVDNAIVVLENVFRHLEMGKTPRRAAYEGAREVFGAVLASTATTVIVFVPVLLIQDEAGQLFRDIALAIIAAVTLSLLTSLTLIPMAASRLMRQRKAKGNEEKHTSAASSGSGGLVARGIGRLTYWLGGSVVLRLLVVVVLTALSVFGTLKLMPPPDYLPQGNRNLVFGMLIPPPGYNLDQRIELARRVEDTVRPFWEAGDEEPGTEAYAEARAALPEVPTFDYLTGQPGAPVVPPPLDNYFIVGFPGGMFHGGISTEPEHVVDLLSLFRHATRAEEAPGVLAFAFQVPLFRLGGATGSAVKINFAGDDLDQVGGAALAVLMEMMGRFGPSSVQPDPSNFNISGPELQVVPDLVRLSEVGLSAQDLGLAVQTLGDGAVIGDYRVGGRNMDLKVMASDSREERASRLIGEAPIATPVGVVPLRSLGELRRINSPSQINREGRQRAVTLQFTPPQGLALGEAIRQVDEILAAHRAAGDIPPSVATSYSGSASKLASVQRAMFGDGSLVGTLSSTMVLALLAVYLLMCVLFQSFIRPLIIMFSVPLATLGGFVALFLVFLWSLSNPYMPIQNLDILTMLGFVILIGVVVNNAILIVHQSRNFMVHGEDGEGPMPPRRAIAEAVRTRVRPIFMSTLTSVGGMAPLVIMPGSGSELYRGLGSVVIGGLLVSTVFTLFLVPSLLGLVTDLQDRLGVLAETRAPSEDFSGPKPKHVAGAVLLLVCCVLPALAGCVAEGREARPRMERVVQAVVEDQLALLGPLDEPAYQPPAAATRVDEVLGTRLEELDRTGGPASYEALDLALPTDLEGVTEVVEEIDLRWAVGAASEHNLGVRLSRERSRIAEQEIEVARAEFDPTIFSELMLETSDEPRTVPEISGIKLGNPRSANDDAALSVGVSKLLTSGGMVTGSTSLTWFDDRSGGISFSPDPSYSTSLSLELAQPLLRGYGSRMNLAELELRRSEYESSEQLLREDLSRVMSAAEGAYWDLCEAWRLLAIQQLLTRRGENVERVLSERRAFDATPAQYSDALATLEQRRANLIRAQRAVALASDRLKALVNDPAHPLAGEGLLRPTDALEARPRATSLREAAGVALLERPEVQRAMLAIESSEIRAQVATNLKEPQLDLLAGAGKAGLDDSTASTYESLFGDDFYRFYVGLSFETPAGRRAALARERQALLENRAAILAFEETVRDVLLEVKEALRDLQTNYTLVSAARAYRIAQTENLRALTAEMEQRSTLTPEFLNLVFQRQEGLAGAQLGEVQALADYNRAVARLEYAMGRGSGAVRIVVGGTEEAVEEQRR